MFGRLLHFRTANQIHMAGVFLHRGADGIDVGKTIKS